MTATLSDTLLDNLICAAGLCVRALFNGWDQLTGRMK